MTAIATPIRHRPRAWLIAAGFGGVLVLALGAVLAATNDGGPSTTERPGLRPIDYRQPNGPKGIVTYTIPGGQAISVGATGEHGGEAHPFAKAAVDGSERYVSPDGKRVAEVQRPADGSVNLAFSMGTVPTVWPLAGPTDPQLVDGGKSQAAAVQGVPLTVAWSPDSKLLAWGSISGEPYTLHVFPVPTDYALSGGYVGELAWSPDGHYLAISTYTMDRKHHSVFLWDAGSGGAPPKYLSDGCHITWSPDSRYIAIHRDPDVEPGSWVLSVDGTYRQAISGDPQSYPQTWEETTEARR